MRILEVTAFPPKIYGVSGSEAQSHNNWYQTIKGALSTIISGDPTDSLILFEPIPRQFKTTQLKVVDLSGLSNNQSTGTCWFPENKEGTGVNTNYTSQIKDGGGNVLKTMKGDLLSDLTACNMQNNAINYWEVPDYYINGYSITHDGNDGYLPTKDTVYGYFSYIQSKIYNGNITYSPGVANRKAGYSQSVSVKLFSPASGNGIEKQIFNVLPAGAVPSDTYKLEYTVGADIRPDGYPIALWNYTDTGEDQRYKMIEYIRGGNWRKIALTNNGLSGSYFSQLGLINSRGNGVVGTSLLFGGGALMAGSGVLMGNEASRTIDNISNSSWLQDKDKLTAPYMQNLSIGRNMVNRGILGMGAAIGSYAVSMEKIGQQDQLFRAKGICAACPQFTNNSDFVKDIGLNKFAYCISRYSDNDLYNYDQFLEKYGYNVGNYPIMERHFYSRLHFTYIKVNEIQTISNPNYKYQVGKTIHDKINIQLQQGVRIWREAPNPQAMFPGGNHEINPVAYRPYNP